MQDADVMVDRLLALAAEMAESRRRTETLASERRRLVVELHDCHGWSDATIARAIGVSRSMVERVRAGR